MKAVKKYEEGGKGLTRKQRRQAKKLKKKMGPLKPLQKKKADPEAITQSSIRSRDKKYQDKIRKAGYNPYALNSLAGYNVTRTAAERDFGKGDRNLKRR